MKISNRTIALLASLLMIASLLYFFTDIVGYVCVAWVLSMIGQPLMRFFQKLKIWRFKLGPNTAAVLTLITYFLFVWLLMWLFVPPILEQINNLAGVNYAAIAQALEQPFQRFEDKLTAFGVIESKDTLEAQLKATLSDWFEPAFIGNYFGNLLSTAGNILVSVASIVFITFFFLKEQGLFVNFIAALMPEQYEDQVRKAISDIAVMLSRYFRGLLLQMIGFTLFVTIFLSILGIKNAILIGFFAGLLNVIPYVGPIIGALFGIILTISSNLEFDFYSVILPKIIKVAIVFGAAQTYDNYVQQPLIFSSSVLAHPLEIFIVILMGAKINGVTGMILAIPAYTVLRAVAGAFLSEFNIVRHLTERMEAIGVRKSKKGAGGQEEGAAN
ncbi:MAG: AI-2E family transporter [Lewinellaceae bacterium]|nr:AI-2E family transporter [Saprospiraceae bacterium]MCB9338278.1 AI-2E family transporter [Lewinellaceae bacterium]